VIRVIPVMAPHSAEWCGSVERMWRNQVPNSTGAMKWREFDRTYMREREKMDSNFVYGNPPAPNGVEVDKGTAVDKGSAKDAEVQALAMLRTWLEDIGRRGPSLDQLCWFLRRLVELGKVRCEQASPGDHEQPLFTVDGVGPQHDRLLRVIDDEVASGLASLVLEGRLCFEVGVQGGYRYLLFLERHNLAESISGERSPRQEPWKAA
jgi:hypothetical protein